MAKSSDLLTGDLGCVAYFVGFVLGPAFYAGASYRVGAEIVGQPILGWILGAVGLLIGLVIEKYVAFGVLLSWFFGIMSALIVWGSARSPR